MTSWTQDNRKTKPPSNQNGTLGLRDCESDALPTQPPLKQGGVIFTDRLVHSRSIALTEKPRLKKETNKQRIRNQMNFYSKIWKWLVETLPVYRFTLPLNLLARFLWLDLRLNLCLLSSPYWAAVDAWNALETEDVPLYEDCQMYEGPLPAGDWARGHWNDCKLHNK